MLRWSGGKWLADIRHIALSAHDADGLVESIEAFASNAVFGPSLKSVSRSSVIGGTGRPGPEVLRPIPQTDLGCHQYDYFRVLSAMSAAPLNAGRAADSVNWHDIKDGEWTGHVAVEVLFPLRTVGGVTADGFELFINLQHGMAVQHDRHSAGDFRKGANVLMEFDRDRLSDARVAHTRPGPRGSEWSANPT
jgi:hypothetical protein